MNGSRSTPTIRAPGRRHVPLAPGPHDSLYRELVPAHGWAVDADSAALGTTASGAEALAAKLLRPRALPRQGARPADGRSAPARSRRRRTRAPQPAPATQPRAAGRPRSRVDRSPAPALDARCKVERTPVPRGIRAGRRSASPGWRSRAADRRVLHRCDRVAFDAGRSARLAILSRRCRAPWAVAARARRPRGWACACAIGGAPRRLVALLRGPAGSGLEPAPLAGLSRCSPARSRSSACYRERSPGRYPQPVDPNPERRSSSTATRRGARCSRSTSGLRWRSSPVRSPAS